MSTNLTTTGRNAPQGDRLTIPAAVWEHRVDGVPLVAGIVGEVLVGVPHAKIIDGTATPADAFGPPADLVALRDAQCGTCDGTGWKYRDQYGNYWGHTIAEAMRGVTEKTACPNPDCDNGRPLVDVRVEMIPYSYHGDPCPCGLPADEHYRTVKGLIDVELIADVIHDDDGTTWLRTPGHNRFADRPAHRLTPAHVEALGTIQPGQWAWLFTEVEA